MKALTCEMCGSTNILKQDGVYVCQSCGTRYSVEEAQKMMVEGPVEIKGTVAIDTSDELENLFVLARQAKDADNKENAAKYYDMILVKEPNSWEANFYSVYYRAMQCKIAEISSAAYNLNNCLPSVFKQLISSFGSSEDQVEMKNSAITEIYKRTISIATMLYNASQNTFLNSMSTGNESFAYDFIDRINNTANLLYSLGDDGINYGGEDFGLLSAEAWKSANKMFTDNAQWVNYAIKNWQQVVNDYSIKIQKYDPSYQPAKVKIKSSGSSGCYVATAVYGSYDCPEVWTLRRFRDFTLDESFVGRAFIKTYYTISPTLVRLFGDTDWFKALWKPILDNMVSKLRNKGFESTPYNDKY